jgi:hypothetical protein
MATSVTAFTHRRTHDGSRVLDVAHTYDLLLQARNPGEAAPVAALVTALTARGAQVNAEGRGLWKLNDGEVSIDPLLEEGLIKGLDVKVPLLDRTALIETVVKELVDIAQLAEGRLTDPQRGDTASMSGLSLLLEEYLRMARYAGEYGAVSGALGLSSYAAQPDDDSPSSLRWLLVVLVFSAALWAGWRTINTIRDANRPDDAPAAMDGAPKVPRK